MPGPITHLIVQQRVAGDLKRFERSGELAELLSSEPCNPYNNFGSMGPDFLFFSLAEYGAGLQDFTNFVFKTYDAFKPLIDFYETTIEPVEDAIDDAVSAIDNALFQGLIGQIRSTADQLTATALQAVAVIATNQVDLFYPFYPKVQQGSPENTWYWIDFLHSRRTGQFASEMWQLAQGNENLMRYVLGYVSHIGTDVVGHCFVNPITGGPYRSHWHRHHLVENWIDAYVRKYYGDTGNVLKCLRLDPTKDHYRADSISSSYYYRLVEFANGKLPGDLAEMFATAMKNTYGQLSPDLPGLLSPTDLDSTYRLWLKWFENATSSGDGEPPAPVPPPGSGITGLASDYVSGFPPPPGFGSIPSGGFSLGGILAAIFAFVSWLVETVLYTLDWIITHAGDILLLPYTEAIGLIKWLLYQVQKGIFEIYDNLRFTLVLGAYIYPEPRDLSKVPWGTAFLNTSSVLPVGISPDFDAYPRRQEQHGLIGSTEHHLTYPSTPVERLHAEAGPLPFHNAFPEAFISGAYQYDPFIENLFTSKAPYGQGPQFTHYVDSNTWYTGQFGNSVNFSVRLIAQHLKELPDFNLDGDRGYGWKTWRAQDPPDVNTSDPLVVNYF